MGCLGLSRVMLCSLSSAGPPLAPSPPSLRGVLRCTDTHPFLRLSCSLRNVNSMNGPHPRLRRRVDATGCNVEASRMRVCLLACLVEEVRWPYFSDAGALELARHHITQLSHRHNQAKANGQIFYSRGRSNALLFLLRRGAGETSAL